MSCSTQPRILHVSTIAITLERFISPIANHIRNLGWTIDAAAAGVCESDTCRRNFDNCIEIPFERTIASIKNLTKARQEIVKTAQKNDYDIVHVHTPIASFVSRVALRNRPSKQKLIYTAHGFHFHSGGDLLQNAVFSRFERLASRWMDHLVVINREDFRNAQELQLATRDNMTLMHGIGVDLNEFAPHSNKLSSRHKVRSELNIPKDSYSFLQIAGFTANKRHCDSVRAFAKLPNDKRFDLIFAGSGQMMDATRKLAKKLNVAERVHFLGYRSDIPELLAACDALLLVSKREGLPRSIMEALAMQKTVIGTDIRGIADLIDNQVGILVPACDPVSLSTAMLKSEDFKPNSAGIQKILEACSQRRIIDQHIELYNRVMAS